MTDRKGKNDRLFTEGMTSLIQRTGHTPLPLDRGLFPETPEFQAAHPVREANRSYGESPTAPQPIAPISPSKTGTVVIPSYSKNVPGSPLRLGVRHD